MNQKWDKAIAILNEINKDEGGNPDILYVIALCYYQKTNNEREDGSNFYEAIRCMEDALSLDPLNGHHIALLAELYYFGALDFQKAAELYRKALEIEPENPDILLSAAMLYGLQEEEVISIDDTLKWLRTAAMKRPKDTLIQSRLGNVLARDGQFNDAIEYWKKSLLCNRPLDDNQVNNILDSLEYPK